MSTSLRSLTVRQINQGKLEKKTAQAFSTSSFVLIRPALPVLPPVDAKLHAGYRYKCWKL
ncbi:hypothetical protein RvY_17863 [Ramazzottius varieornatus]|uniref:Uncharacterized protein n=1 Tax=Ramazzottius varieornatus TaxID=947166 RepID=A0A1D1W5N3_RAMVA|nr:hypothetical protein RvY_17863 [Ramazzottius varieornatus]